MPASLRLARVYPRVCGGTSTRSHIPVSKAGLSPRVRGNRHGRRRGVKSAGSIPACAGEPDLLLPDASDTAVYPRVCGGTIGSKGCHLKCGGLSPRVRGNPAHAPVPAACGRSIPACAGEPGDPRRLGDFVRVYPRVCGGTRLQHQYHGVINGLSPRVRGNPHRGRAGPHRSGSIPACAGEPPGGLGWPGAWRVYPRVCGGTSRLARACR